MFAIVINIVFAIATALGTVALGLAFEELVLLIYHHHILGHYLPTNGFFCLWFLALVLYSYAMLF